MALASVTSYTLCEVYLSKSNWFSSNTIYFVNRVLEYVLYIYIMDTIWYVSNMCFIVRLQSMTVMFLSFYILMFIFF